MTQLMEDERCGAGALPQPCHPAATLHPVVGHILSFTVICPPDEDWMKHILLTTRSAVLSSRAKVRPVLAPGALSLELKTS